MFRQRQRIRKRADIGIVFSLDAEGRLLIRDLTGRTKVEGIFHGGCLAGKHVILAVSGIGKVNAAHAAASLILDFRPSVVMNIGIGGAYPASGLKIGDVAIAEKEIYGDEGVLLKDGFYGLDLIGIPLLRNGRKKYFNEFTLDKMIARKAVKVARSFLAANPSTTPLIRGGKGGVKVKAGTFLTLSTCTGTKKRAVEIEKRTGAICENMEGAAIAQICAFYDIPMIEMRGISNIVEDRDTTKWNIKLASENCQKAAKELINIL